MLNKTFNQIKLRLFYIFNYFIKPIFYIHNLTISKLNYDWEASNSDRVEVLNAISKKISAKKYLEIGCDLNQVFDKVDCNFKIGVDPERGGTIRDTSDNFFKYNEDKFDLIFIDGLHTFEQIFKDFNNSFNCLNEGGYIVMHDLIPRTWLEEHVPRISNNWCGDVWKISFLLNNIEDHKYNLLLTDFGLGIFKKKNKYLKTNNINISKKNFSYFYKNFFKLNLTKKENFFTII